MNLIQKLKGQKPEELDVLTKLETEYDHSIRQIRAKGAFDRAEDKFFEQQARSPSDRFWDEEPEKELSNFFCEELEGEND